MNARRFGILKNIHGYPKLIHNHLINNYGFTPVSFDTLKNNRKKDMLLVEMDELYDKRDPYFEGDRFVEAGIFRILVPTVFHSTGYTKGNVVYVQDYLSYVTKTLNEFDKLMNKWDIWSKHHV